MGVVWAAHRLDTLEPVAIKLISETEDPAAPRRLLREARAAAAVRHPNVVAVREILAGATPAIVMDLLRGSTLTAKLAGGERLSLGETASLLLPVVSAVGTAHTLGIIHRDLKPENIFIVDGFERESTVKVLDFGIAKLTALDGDAARTAGLTTTAVLGTPAYMAPEQAFGERDVDQRADVWSLGMILYQCLTGVLLTDGDNVGQVLKNVLARRFPPIGELVPALADDVANLVDRMLSRDRAWRPRDLREVFTVLRSHTDVPAPAFGEPNIRVHPVRAEEGAATPVNRAGALDSTLQPKPHKSLSARHPHRGRSGRRLALTGLACLVAGAALCPPAPTVVPQPSPPQRALLIGCLPFLSEGVEEPGGWLGAAAAATTCERARVILGGRSDRTLVPAELLALPTSPVDGFPSDPYSQADSRDRALKTVRRRGALYFDGTVIKRGADFRVAMRLHTTDGAQIDESEGGGGSLYEAVREAMTPLVLRGALPKANSLDPIAVDWSRARDVDEALGQIDFALAQAHHAAGFTKECELVDARAAAGAEMAPIERWICAYTRGLPAPQVNFPLSQDATPGAIAADALARHMVQRADEPETTISIQNLFKRETTAWGMAALAATASCLLQGSNPSASRDMALLAVQAEPKNPDGYFCRPWGQLLAVTRGTATADSTVRAMQAWVPWDGYGWLFDALARRDLKEAVALARRAHVLSPLDVNIAGVLVDKLLAAGERESARIVAATVTSGDSPVQRVQGMLLGIRVEASEAHFGAALALARRALPVSAADVGWVRVQKLEVAWRALEIAEILGIAPELADEIVAQLIEPEPTPLDGVYLTTPICVPAICALASAAVSRRCFARLRDLRPRLSGGVLASTDAFVKGAERYALGDLGGAANAWRSVVSNPDMLVLTMAGPMTEAFAHSGDVELIERIDSHTRARAVEFNGASMADVRAARRAFRAGNAEEARALAKKVIEAWSAADGTVPFVSEMRRLLNRRP